MDNTENGETSRNSENSNGERPFKKAKYAWQVKGNYHLKDDANESSAGESINEIPKANANPENSSNQHNCSKAYVDMLIKKCDEVSDRMDIQNVPSKRKNMSDDNLQEVPITLVKPHTEDYDYFLKKWQTRQVARGFVDNTINKVLDNWVMIPFVDASELLEVYDNDGKVEDEGILMAIQSHGLQSGAHNDVASGSNNLSNISTDNHNDLTENSDVAKSKCCCSLRNSSNESSVSREATNSVPFHRRLHSYYNDYNTSENIDRFKLRDEFLVEDEVNYDIINDKNNENIKMDMDDQNIIEKNQEDNIFEHINVLDAAVSVAIQNKGLVSFSCADGI